MIAIGSCIGTGLLIGCGKILHTGGPLALVLSFTLVGIALAIMMQGLGELAVVLPVTGGVTDYATRFFNDSLGFAISWQYWLAWVAIFGAEASAFSVSISSHPIFRALRELGMRRFLTRILHYSF